MIYVQYFLSPHLGILATVPNLLLPVVMYFSVTRSNITSLVLAFILGLILDFNSPANFGFSPFLFVILAYVLGELKTRINREQKIFVILTLFLSHLLYFFFYNLFSLLSTGNLGLPFSKILFLAFYNSCYSAVVILIISVLDRMEIRLKKAE
jgi:rod shape-determining protein MreD